MERCRPADEVESWLHDPALKIIGAADTKHGIQGAKVLTLFTSQSGGVVFRAKWRPDSSRAQYNNPRWELGAHAVQKLFLEPHEYVVPPGAGHCFPLAEYRTKVQADARETVVTVPCVFGILSYWLEDARPLEDAHEEGMLADDDRAYDPALFRRSEAYRNAIADLNLVTYLIHHGDSHPRQFLVAGTASDARVYSVDNSLSFGRFRNPTVIENWANVLVPGIPGKKIDRLKRLRTDEIDGLAVIEQYSIRYGQLVPTRRTEPGPEKNAGLRWRGRELQIGLTGDEIHRVRRRLGKLLIWVSKGEIETF